MTRLAAFTVTRSAQQAPESERAEDWRSGAECLTEDPERFFPHPTDLLGTRAAQDVCARCDVIEVCAAYALRPAHPEHYGVWGGMSEDERRQILRRQGRGQRRHS